MAKEPRVSVSTIDNTIGYSADPVDNRLNILCPIIAPAGPTELTRVSGPSELKRLYFGGRSIKTSDHMSAIYARALSANAPIWIKRGVRDNLKGGVSSSLGSEVFVDSSLSLISGKKVNLTLDSTQITTYESQITELETKGGVLNGVNFYSTSESDVPESIKRSSAQVTLKKKLTLKSEVTTDQKIVIGNNQYTITSGTTSLMTLIQLLHDNKLMPQAVYGKKDGSEDVTLLPVHIEDDKIAVTGTPTAIAWVTNIAIVASEPFEVGEESTSISSVILKTPEEYISEYEIKNFDFKISMSDGVSTYEFYTDGVTPTATQTAKITGKSFEEVTKSLISLCADLLGADSGNGNSIVIPEAKEVTVTSDQSIVKAEVTDLNLSIDNDKFAVIAAFPCSSDLITVEISETNVEGIYNIKASYDQISEEWNVSFVSGMFDGYGESLYFQRVNEESQIIRIVELNGPNVLPQTLRIGDEITSQYCGVAEIITALENMKESDESSVYFDYITDGGIVDQSLSNYIFSLCKFYYSFYAPSVPTDVPLTINKLKTLRATFGNQTNGRLIAHTQRESVLESGSVVMPASYFYLRRRIELGNTALEFVNLFGQNYGDIGMQSPLQRFTTADREALLDVQTVTLKKSISGSYYLNEDLTLYQADSFLQEDGIVLMINKINQIADGFGHSLIGESVNAIVSNDSSLRASVTFRLSNLLSGRLRVGTSYGPVSINVVCNDTNNPVQLQNQGKLRIDIYATFSKSVKEVLIYSNIMPLS